MRFGIMKGVMLSLNVFLKLFLKQRFRWSQLRMQIKVMVIREVMSFVFLFFFFESFVINVVIGKVRRYFFVGLQRCVIFLVKLVKIGRLIVLVMLQERMFRKLSLGLRRRFCQEDGKDLKGQWNWVYVYVYLGVYSYEGNEYFSVSNFLCVYFSY